MRRIAYGPRWFGALFLCCIRIHICVCIRFVFVPIPVFRSRIRVRVRGDYRESPVRKRERIQNTGTEKIDRSRAFCYIQGMRKTFDQKLLREFSEKNGLQLLVLFGSQASGKTHPKSDTDIGFVSARKKNLLETIDMQRDMSQACAIRDLDLVDLRAVSPLFLKNITDSGVVLYEERPGIFSELRMYAFKLFVETKPLRALRAASLERFLQKDTVTK